MPVVDDAPTSLGYSRCVFCPGHFTFLRCIRYSWMQTNAPVVVADVEKRDENGLSATAVLEQRMEQIIFEGNFFFFFSR